MIRLPTCSMHLNRELSVSTYHKLLFCEYIFFLTYLLTKKLHSTRRINPAISCTFSAHSNSVVHRVFDNRTFWIELLINCFIVLKCPYMSNTCPLHIQSAKILASPRHHIVQTLTPRFITRQWLCRLVPLQAAYIFI